MTESTRSPTCARQRRILFNFAVRTRVANGHSRAGRAAGIHGTLENPRWDYEAWRRRTAVGEGEGETADWLADWLVVAQVEIPGGELSCEDIYIPGTYPPVNPWPAIRAVGLPAVSSHLVSSRLVSSPLSRCLVLSCAWPPTVRFPSCKLVALGGR